jgi:hypothetical protein
MTRNTLLFIGFSLHIGCIGINEDQLIGHSDRPVDSEDLLSSEDEFDNASDPTEDAEEDTGSDSYIVEANNIESQMLTEDPEDDAERLSMELDDRILSIEHTLLWAADGVSDISIEADLETNFLNIDYGTPTEADTWFIVSYTVELVELPVGTYTMLVEEENEVEFTLE